MNKAALTISALLLAAATTTTARADSIWFKDGIIHTVTGETLSPGSVLVTDGKIIAVGAKVDAPRGAKVIELKGQHLYPGMIALDSAVGLAEVESVRSTLDTTETGEFKPDIQSWIAVNPDSELIPVARANGITHVEPAPQGAIVGGMSGVVALDGWTTEQMAIKRTAALHLYWPEMSLSLNARGGRGGGGGPPPGVTPGRGRLGLGLGAGGGGPRSSDEQAKERLAKIKVIDDFFLEARAYAKALDAFKQGKGADPGPSTPWQGMLPVVRGEVPIMVHAEDLRQIKTAVKWAQTNNYKIIIVGGRDAWQVPELLATNKIPVIYEFTFGQQKGAQDPYDVYFKAPEVMRKAGVTVAFSVGQGLMQAPTAKNLPYEAAQCVAFGLPEEEALKGMTLYPAQILGVADRLGSIEPGKEATLFVADGSIMDLRAHVKHVWIAGHEVSLDSRHTRLYEKYKNRPLPK